MTVSFAELKARITIEQVADHLGLELKKTGDSWRGPCPCGSSDGKRSLALTPSKGLFYSFCCKKGGDALELAAFVRKISTKQAAEELAEAFGETRQTEQDFAPLPYLDAAHPSLEAIGLPQAIGEGIGAGFAPKGTMKGCVCIPLRTPAGKLVGYLGVNLASDPPVKLPSKWHL